MKNIIIQHPAVLLLGLVIAALAAFLFYWRDKKFDGTRPAILILLRVLRFLSIFLIFLLLASIIIRHRKLQIEKPQIVILQDNSASIRQAYNNSFLEKNNQNLLNLQKELQKKFNVTLLTFDSELHSSPPTYNGNITDISRALMQIKAKYYNQNLAAVILLSDGIYNRGADPSDITQTLPFKIFTVGMGDTVTYRDLAVNSISANKYVYQGNNFEVKIKTSAIKAKGKPAVVKLLYDGQPVESKEWIIGTNRADTTFTFTIEAKEKGQHIVKAVISVVEGERNKINNSSARVVEVINTRKKILIVSAFPHPDISALRRSVSNITGLKSYYIPLDKFTNQADSANLVVIYQLPDNKHSASKLFRSVANNEVPFLLITGGKTDYNLLSTYGLGIKINVASKRFDEASAVANSSFSLFELPGQFETMVSSMPPLITPFADISIAGDTSVLFYKRIKGITTHEPLFVFFKSNPLNNNKAGIILGEGIWRWPMYEYRTSGSDGQTMLVFRKTIEYLLAAKNKNRFTVSYPGILPADRDMVFEAQVYDHSYNPVTNAVVEITLRDSANRNFKYTLNNNGQTYSLNIGKLSPGTYNFSATATIVNEKLNYNGQFTVLKLSPEKQQTQADFELLKKLAQTNGGKFIPYDSLKLASKIIADNTESTATGRSTFFLEELINYRWIAFIILFTLVLEWILRKYSGSI